MLPLITDVQDLSGKRVLLRLDLNVPIAEGKVANDFRITKSLPTIKYLLRRGAKLVVISHLGKGKEDTLKPVAEYLRTFVPVTFLPNLLDPENHKIIDALPSGEIAVLENLRHSEGEEQNDPDFSKYLASYGDIYVNDAFAVSHRAHASVVGVTDFLPSYAGMLLADEVHHLAVAEHPEHPFLFILGGAKIGTKMPLLKKYLERADHVFVGGALVNNFFKGLGYEIGTSLFDAEEVATLGEYLHHPKLILPTDVIVKTSTGSVAKQVTEVLPGEMIVDIGPDTISAIEAVIGEAKLVLWNGPLGFYEEGFKDATRKLLLLIAESDATSVLGGGDTVALIDEMHYGEEFTFVSTGGGAMLDYLANDTLPGIEALKGSGA